MFPNYPYVICVTAPLYYPYVICVTAPLYYPYVICVTAPLNQYHYSTYLNDLGLLPDFQTAVLLYLHVEVLI